MIKGFVKVTKGLQIREAEYFVIVDNDYKAVAMFVDGKFWANDLQLNVTSYLDETVSPGWVSVEERLPENEQEVIVYFKNSVGWHVVTAYWDGENFITLCEVCGSREQFTYKTPITHWMPLPQPPKH